MVDTNCTPENKQPVIYEGDVGEPAVHAQEKQEETQQQTEEQRRDSQGKEGEQVSAQTLVQTDNQTEKGEILPKGDNESRLRPADTTRTEEREPQLTKTREVATSEEGTEETRLISS